MKKLAGNTSQTLETMKSALQEQFPEYRVRIAGVAKGRRVIVSRSMFCGVDVCKTKNGELVVRGSLMPSTTAVVLFGVGCAAGMIGGFIFGVCVGWSGSRIEAEVAGALSLGVA